MLAYQLLYYKPVLCTSAREQNTKKTEQTNRYQMSLKKCCYYRAMYNKHLYVVYRKLVSFAINHISLDFGQQFVCTFSIHEKRTSIQNPLLGWHSSMCLVQVALALRVGKGHQNQVQFWPKKCLQLKKIKLCSVKLKTY